MKTIYKILFLFIAVAVCGGCKKQFEDNFKNPNQAESVPPNLVLNGILYDMYEAPFSDSERWNQYTASNYAYYAKNEYNWNEPGVLKLDYTTLKNVGKMEEEANRLGGEVGKPYLALAKFFKAYFFVKMSLKVGDIPMMEALKGVANLTPKYDTQKDVFKQSLLWLEEANQNLSTLIAAGNKELKGDIYLKNDLVAWQKVVNTFKLRVLIHLSNRVDDADLQVKQQFAAVLDNPTKYPVMDSMADNLQFVYNESFNKYPNNKDNFGNDALRYNMAGTYLNTLSALKDPRAYMVAEPARGIAEANGYAITDYRNFVGANSGEDQGVMLDKVQKGLYSLIGRYRYYSGYTAENTFIISYPELCFIKAEGINRGWANGDAESWYKKGIQASIGFYGIKDGSNAVTFLKKDGKLGEFESFSVNFNFETDYYAQTAVKYAGNTATGLTQILTQKYLAFFRNSGFEAYYQYRRTNIPEFQTGPGTGNSQRIPKRFQYTTIERTTNGDNLKVALQRQYNGVDDINLAPWIVK
ncbi:SusD/RagB family nutrient-binding outer membrane lipoprotein [Pedobacter jeongneungensis]|uniref:SusD/RagB family nutrient-binding outer membrane lipoprotein n=1 Tax=Pedobacter jeongneungensis TaxID=947309 RepID=A0ABP8BNQ0_9SPHI